MAVLRCIGGVEALTSDGDELRKSVEFATACGAYVTQVGRAQRGVWVRRWTLP